MHCTEFACLLACLLTCLLDKEERFNSLRRRDEARERSFVSVAMVLIYLYQIEGFTIYLVKGIHSFIRSDWVKKCVSAASDFGSASASIDGAT